MNPQNYSKTHFKSMRKAWLDFLSSLAPWSLAATVTFKRQMLGEAVNQKIIESALVHTLRLMDISIYGKNHVSKGSHVASVVVIGWGPYKQNPHAHIALAGANQYQYEQMKSFLDEAISRTQWLNIEREIKPYQSDGWMQYMVDHCPENLVLSLLRPGFENAKT